MLTTKQKIRKIEAEVFTEENYHALMGLKESLKALSRVINVSTRKKRAENYSLSSFVREHIKEKIRNCVLFFVDGVSRNNLSLIMKKAEMSKKAKKIGDYEVKGHTVRPEYSYTKQYSDDQGNVISHSPHVSTFNNGKAIIIPVDRNEQMRLGYGPYVVITHKDNEKETREYLDSLIEIFSPAKCQFIIVEGGNIHHKNNFSPIFDLDKVVLEKSVYSEVKTIAKMFENYDEYVKHNIPFKTSICFWGDPGVGKTTAIQALIQSVINAEGTVFQFLCSSSYTIEKNVTNLYKVASDHAPALVIIEDFDLIAKERQSSNLTTNLLNVLSGNAETPGVISIFTTNDINIVDPAAKRAGRIDRITHVDYPTNEMKKDLLKIHFERYKIELPIENAINSCAPIFNQRCTGAEIDAIVRGAMNKSLSEKRNISPKDLLWACGNSIKDAPHDSTVGF